MHHAPQATADVETRDIIKGALAGLIAGVIASWAMNQFHTLTSQLAQATGDDEGDGARSSQDEQSAEQAPAQEPATVKAAEAISQRVLYHELTQQEKRKAGPMMHYGFGATVGGAYGMLAEVVPVITVGQGTGYGTAVWLIADEVAVPALGFSAPPTEHPPSTHASALGAHLAYGLVVELVRRSLRPLL